MTGPTELGRMIIYDSESEVLGGKKKSDLMVKKPLIFLALSAHFRQDCLTQQSPFWQLRLLVYNYRMCIQTRRAKRSQDLHTP